eukprot:m.48284 g.48284  ORF g.48284 m.48284 type:complete len:1256 (-) comp11988_c0_seq1:149-3916(-)
MDAQRACAVVRRVVLRVACLLAVSCQLCSAGPSTPFNTYSEAEVFTVPAPGNNALGTLTPVKLLDSLACDGYDAVLVMYGGLWISTDSAVASTGTYIYVEQQQHWLATTLSGPSNERVLHTAVAVYPASGPTIVVFGGLQATSFDPVAITLAMPVNCQDPKVAPVTTLPDAATGISPAARFGHAAAPLPGGTKMVVHGGCGAVGATRPPVNISCSHVLDDAWVLDTVTYTWSQLSAQTPKRWLHAPVLLKAGDTGGAGPSSGVDQIVFLGGSDTPTKVSSFATSFGLTVPDLAMPPATTPTPPTAPPVAFRARCYVHTGRLFCAGMRNGIKYEPMLITWTVSATSRSFVQLETPTISGFINGGGVPSPNSPQISVGSGGQEEPTGPEYLMYVVVSANDDNDEELDVYAVGYFMPYHGRNDYQSVTTHVTWQMLPVFYGANTSVPVAAWLPVPTLQAPTPRFGLTAVTLASPVGTAIACYGGSVAQGAPPISQGELWILLTRTEPTSWQRSTWRQLFLFPKPEPRTHHIAVRESNTTMLVFGGAGAHAALHDTWRLDTQTFQWTNLSGAGPAASRGACGVFYDSSIIVFGGASNLLQTSNGLWMGRVDSPQAQHISWSRKSVTGVVPPARYGAASTLHRLGDGTEVLVVYGGFNSSLDSIDDMWMLDLQQWQWRQGPRVGPRVGACLVSMYNSLVMFGGVVGFQSGMMDRTSQILPVWNEKRGWQRLFTETPGTVQDGSIQLTTQRAQSACVVQPADVQTLDAGYIAPGTLRLLVLGGYNHGSFKPQFTPLFIKPGCSPGWYSPEPFGKLPCQPCSLGMYEEKAGQTNCSSVCPADSYTAIVGATTIKDCDVCAPDVCNNGQCDLNALTFAISCRCLLGYSTFDRCRYPVYPVVGTILAVIGVVALGYIAVVLRRRFHAHREYEELQQQLLDETRQDVELLTKAWTIDYNDVRMGPCVGHGGFGAVYKGEWNGIPVAVKQLHEALQHLDEQIVDDFQQEAQQLQRLRDKHIVLFLGAGMTPSGCPFLVTEFASRGSLAALVKQTAAGKMSLPWQMRMNLALGAAEGMRFLHSVNRIHRDLKTDNILVTQQWEAKVADLGTARLLNQLQSKPGNEGLADGGSNDAEESVPMDTMQLTHGIGTPICLAPEQLERSSYGQPVDVYAFSMCLFELLALERPFSEARYSFHITEAVLQGKRPLLREVRVGPEAMTCRPTPEQVKDLMARCWVQDPAARPSFANIVAELECNNLADQAEACA